MKNQNPRILTEMKKSHVILSCLFLTILVLSRSFTDNNPAINRTPAQDEPGYIFTNVHEPIPLSTIHRLIMENSSDKLHNVRDFRLHEGPDSRPETFKIGARTIDAIRLRATFATDFNRSDLAGLSARIWCSFQLNVWKNDASAQILIFDCSIHEVFDEGSWTYTQENPLYSGALFITKENKTYEIPENFYNLRVAFSLDDHVERIREFQAPDNEPEPESKPEPRPWVDITVNCKYSFEKFECQYDDQCHKGADDVSDNLNADSIQKLQEKILEHYNASEVVFTMKTDHNWIGQGRKFSPCNDIGFSGATYYFKYK